MSTAHISTDVKAPTEGVGPAPEAPVAAPGVRIGGFTVSWGTLLGTVPIYIGLALIWIYFDTQTAGKFLGARNLSNMVQQFSYKPVLALGIVLVLLLGEIDLSVGYLTQLSAVLCATFLVTSGWPAGPSIALTIAICTVAGLIQGALVSWVRMPSFVVTLGGFLIFEGLANHITGPSSINVLDPFINSLGTYYVPNNAAWVITAVIAVLYVAYRVAGRAARARAGVSVPPTSTFAVSIVGPIVVLAGFVALMNHYIGVPIAFVILSAFVVAFWYLTKRLRYGRHIYAVGGNPEASRRAGINTTAIKWTVFGISGCMAGVAGVMLLGYQPTASTTIVTGDLLLDVISIAVIGGVSLTGGRGSVWAVLLGGLVIGSVDSGLTLMNTDPYLVSVVKGSILVIAILIDVLGKRFSGLVMRH
ncbi:MAG: inner-rane translocator [Chloroflexi bacterium]|nr:inner-rane translocator [Chloroflexota bacterium]